MGRQLRAPDLTASKRLAGESSSAFPVYAVYTSLLIIHIHSGNA